MDHEQDPEPRLTRLEIKASYAEDLLDALNQTVFRQQQQIDALRHVVAQLRQQLPTDASTPVPSSSDELPPHY